MDLFKCTLSKAGIVYENFFKEGISSTDILEDLESFQWPSAPNGAKWSIDRWDNELS